MNKFYQFKLPETLLKSLDEMNFKVPTPIQEQTIRAALEGQDILGTAQTGTGKTGAFAIPLSAKLLTTTDESVLVLTPTRELALQVISVFHKLLASDRSIRTALLIGGESIERQFKQLKAQPRLVVGTPGRMNDHLKRGTLKIRNTRSLVLDETDLMLDMGFDVQIASIIEKMPEERQTLMFSATMPKNIEGLSGKYLKSPVRVSVGRESTPVQNLVQDVLLTTETDKYTNLTLQLDQRDGSIIVFVKTKRGADKLSAKLNSEHYESGSIHGDLKQSKREQVLRAFRDKKKRIMIATDLAARGIDVPHIRHVINYDLPQCAEDYIHRIGRTARAGQKGEAISFVTKQDRGKWAAIERLLNPDAKRDKPSRDGPSTGPKKPGKRKPRFAPSKFKKSKKAWRPAA